MTPPRVGERLVPYKDVDGFAVVGAKHNVGRTQEGLQHVNDARRHLLHLVKDEDGASALRQVSLHPTLQLLLQAGAEASDISAAFLYPQLTFKYTENRSQYSDP